MYLEKAKADILVKMYYELSCKVSPSYIKTFTELAFDLGIIAVEEKDGSIILRSFEELDNFELAFKTLNESLKPALFELDIKQKADRDWIKEYKKSIKAIKIKDLYIHTSWQRPHKRLINICIDPALAFGSGHHASTNACLEFLQKYISKDMEVLDLGCGSGILGISALKLGAVVDSCDIDELALEVSLENAKKNFVFFKKTWLGSAKDALKPYDLILVNIVADIIILLEKDIKKLLKKGSILILSGIINERVKKLKEKFQDLKLIDFKSDDEWSTLVYKG